MYVAHCTGGLRNIDALPQLDRLLFLQHGWRFVVFDVGRIPVSVHRSYVTAEKCMVDIMVERDES